MTIQGPPGNNSNHPGPIRGNGNASRAHQVPFTTPLPVDHLLGKLFKYLMRCGRGARAVQILPPWQGVVLIFISAAGGLPPRPPPPLDPLPPPSAQATPCPHGRSPVDPPASTAL